MNNGKSKALSLVLAGTMALSMGGPAMAAKDQPVIAEKPWYAEAQAYVTEKGLMQGTDQGFEPEGRVTRAMVFQTLYNMAGKPDVEKKVPFTDVTEKSWYADSAAWAYDAGLAKGDSGLYAGDRAVTRQETAAILYRYEQSMGGGFQGSWMYRLPFNDLEDIADWAFESVAWCNMKEIMTGRPGEIFAPRDVLNRAELATVLMKADGKFSPGELTMEEYLAQTQEQWFLTGKKEYTIEGMMVSKDTPFHNPLENVDYVAKDDGISVVLKGTYGEQWITKLEKVLKTYTREDGSALTADDFTKKDSFVTLKTKAAPDTNFAMKIPAGTFVSVNTAWGDVLHANAAGVPHGEGDYLVCRAGEDGKPDLSDVWVVNGTIFPDTYDMPTAPAEA